MAEALAARCAHDPGCPCAAESEAHEATRVSFQSWCSECTAGREDSHLIGQCLQRMTESLKYYPIIVF